MPLADGTRLEHYEIVGLLGAGGMGEVYRAVDGKLRREVALKILPPKFAADPARLARFEREAHLLASLNHSNIAAIYGLEHCDGIRFLVLELIEGPTLAERLKSGPMEIGETLKIAAGVAEALEAAHEKGVVHRDLKPGNVKLTSAGKVKVLDFGLAKALGDPEPTQSSADPEGQATATMQETRAGVVMGTAAYMSPEQAEGRPTDKRSDVWSFGVMLYEMLSGRRCFEGKSTSHIIVHVLEQEPDWEKLPAGVPTGVRHLLERCLQKDPAQRLRDVGDLRLQLEAMAKQASAAPRTGPVHMPPARAERRWWLWPAIAAALAVILAITVWELRPNAPARATRFQVTLPENVEFDEYVSISPDGHKLVFNATGDKSGLWIHDLDTLEWRRLEGTEGGRSPFWSPDSKYLGFGVGNQLKKIDAAGGPAQTLCTSDFLVASGAWNRDSVIIFGGYGRGVLQRVSSAGGIPVALTTWTGFQPAFLPDGKHFLYALQRGPQGSGIYSGSLDAKPAEQSKQRIVETEVGARLVAGNLFFLRDGTLMVQAFDAAKLQVRGDPVPVAEHVGRAVNTGLFSVSTTGVLAYRTGANVGAGAFQPTWFDRQGKVAGTVGQPGPDRGLVLSPDGTRAAGRDAITAASGDIWVIDFARGVRTRLTFHQSTGSFPVWSPDGSRIIFYTGNADTLYEKSASGAGDEMELLKTTGQATFPTSVSRDGRFLLYQSAAPKTGSDIWALPLQGERKPVKLLATNFDEFGGSFSPDGRWVAYISNESSRSEIYVRPFQSAGSSAPSLGEGKWQISRDGAANIMPRWRRDGKEIFFVGLNFNAYPSLMAVEVNGSDAAFQMGTPKPLFRMPTNTGIDVSSDGQRFLMTVAQGLGQQTPTPITVVLNWQADLKR